jgi:hypothetical protein
MNYNNGECNTNRGSEWLEFSDKVLFHVDKYTVNQYGDAPDDEVEQWTPEDCVRSIAKYIARFGKNQRGLEDQKRDMLKIAHFACFTYNKLGV